MREGKFYLAAPYDRREEMSARASEIENLTIWRCHEAWRCCSRWLSGDLSSDSPESIARKNFSDLGEANALVLFHGKSTTGGMWCELGFAIAKQMPILVMDGNDFAFEPPCFAFPREWTRWCPIRDIEGQNRFVADCFRGLPT